ncbi:MAG: tetratricopeptide repeat-containing protein [Ancalomicrobiaceae bacterium]|nr:tetratricopeptide repeat-containing protein [Ancalomicrobiaceae bacterium]
MTRLPAQAQIPSLGMAAILRRQFEMIDNQPLIGELIGRIDRDPTDATALYDISLIRLAAGFAEEALDLQRQAVAVQRDFRIVHGTGQGLRLLAFVTPGDFMANTPVDFLLVDSDVELWLHYVDADTADLADLPEHDVALVTVAESPTNAAVLARLHQLLASWQGPILNNRPEVIAGLTRDGVTAMLADEPSILAPKTVRVARAGLERVAAGQGDLPSLADGVDLPAIVRPIGTHAGGGMQRIGDRAELADYLAAQSGEAFFLAPFVDYRGADGLFTKQRIVLIDGKPFPSHMALSEHWMVHYLSAGMLENAEKRAVEARWMRDFDDDFARRHADAFAALHRKVGLDYFGIDSAESTDGRLIVFELDVAMVVHDMDSAEIYPYKKPAMRQLFDAFLAMLAKRVAGQPGTGAGVGAKLGERNARLLEAH